MTHLWLGKAPLVLASKSAARRALLDGAGLPFEAVAAEIDERAIEAPLRAAAPSAEAIAAHLARPRRCARRALGRSGWCSAPIRCWRSAARFSASRRIGGGAGTTRKAFRAHACAAFGALRCARRKRAVRDGRDGPAHLPRAQRGFHRPLSRRRRRGGARERRRLSARGLGVHLFEKIEGDHATILGLPLLPLLAFLRQEGSLAA